jgi:deoxyhypusine monooxygenase
LFFNEIFIGFQSSSALFRHETAFVLGQLQSICSIPALRQQLSILNENYMVRHECAETLGSIGTDECRDILQAYLNDKERVVRESCEVALDISDYVNGSDFQYCNGLKLVESECC